MAQTQRAQKVGDLLQRELAFILQRELADPRLGFVTITEVDVSPDLRQAKIYVTCLPKADQGIFDQNAQQNQIYLLQGSVSFIRRLLTKRVQLRVLPRLQFLYDETANRAYRIAQCLSDSAVCYDQRVEPL